MLEIKHLTKTYKTGSRGGAEAAALQDVSVSFEDTGLVFLLGKSGCGKSTFLNCAGGLDAPSSGEIIVDGRSSKDFTQADWDSYRNTCVGFVFQEYNVLDEFSVADNVALALELQGRKHEREKVLEILREIGLEEFADRKPGTLSGGQKQRVAIARALVKAPKIIMADEPTGALDSGTGRQILDLLKSLSKTRLVIVVSHDREFARSFADRIIELADGRIVPDTSGSLCQDPAKGKEKQQSAGSGNSFIRSRLPIGRAIRMGLSGLKVKPVRLVITMILSVAAFVIFGLLSCLMMYNGATVAANTFATGDENYFALLKAYRQFNTWTYYDGSGQAVTESRVYSFFGPEDAPYFGCSSSEVLYGCDYYSPIEGVSWSLAPKETHTNTQPSARQYTFRKAIPCGTALRAHIRPMTAR
ncbi:MAG: ABC transporter ATP-binding protein [Clostridia bacterium]|nr:ABC transporter ATP-binding protein [Clostridia bacterium]